MSPIVSKLIDKLKPGPWLVYPMRELRPWLRTVHPAALRWLERETKRSEPGEDSLWSIDFADRERSPVDDYGMSAEELEAMRWLRAELGAGRELLLVGW